MIRVHSWPALFVACGLAALHLYGWAVALFAKPYAPPRCYRCGSTKHVKKVGANELCAKCRRRLTCLLQATVTGPYKRGWLHVQLSRHFRL